MSSLPAAIAAEPPQGKISSRGKVSISHKNADDSFESYLNRISPGKPWEASKIKNPQRHLSLDSGDDGEKPAGDDNLKTQTGEETGSFPAFLNPLSETQASMRYFLGKMEEALSYESSKSGGDEKLKPKIPGDDLSSSQDKKLKIKTLGDEKLNRLPITGIRVSALDLHIEGGRTKVLIPTALLSRQPVQLEILGEGDILRTFRRWETEVRGGKVEALPGIGSIEQIKGSKLREGALDRISIERNSNIPIRIPAEKTPEAAPMEKIHISNLPEQIFFRIIRVMERGDRGGEREIKFILDPPNLGEVKISLDIGKNGLKAHFYCSSETARNAIAQNIETLREGLLAHGFHLNDSFINYSQGNPGGFHNHPGETFTPSSSQAVFSEGSEPSGDSSTPAVRPGRLKMNLVDYRV